MADAQKKQIAKAVMLFVESHEYEKMFSFQLEQGELIRINGGSPHCGGTNFKVDVFMSDQVDGIKVYDSIPVHIGSVNLNYQDIEKFLEPKPETE